MPSSKQLQQLFRSPSAHMRFLMTGRLPEGVSPSGPLVELLGSISPGDLHRFRGLVVGEALGYGGSRRFNSAHQALLWVAPSKEVFGAFPAESWRLKSFNRRLFLQDILAQCEEAPALDWLRTRYPRLVA